MAARTLADIDAALAQVAADIAANFAEPWGGEALAREAEWQRLRQRRDKLSKERQALVAAKPTR